MTLKAQANPTQTWSARGRTQVLAVFIVSLALLVALVGLAVVSRPAVATHAAVTPTIIDRGADQSSATKVVLDRGADQSSATKVVLDRGADQSSATLNSAIYGPKVNASTGFDLNATKVVLDRGADQSSATLNSTIYGPRVNASTGFDLNAASPSILDRGADR